MGKKKDKKSKKEKKQKLPEKEISAEKSEKEDEQIMRAEEISNDSDSKQEPNTETNQATAWKIKNDESENKGTTEDMNRTSETSETDRTFTEFSAQSEIISPNQAPSAKEAWEYASGIVTILLSLVLAVDAYLMVSGLYENGISVSGQNYVNLMSAMFSAFMAVLMLVTGIITIATRKSDGYSSDVPVLILSACAATTGFTGTIISEEKFLLIAVWCAVVSIASMSMLLMKRREKQSTRFWPIALVICFATLLMASFGETYLIRTETQTSSIQINEFMPDISNGIFGESEDRDKNENNRLSDRFQIPGQSDRNSQKNEEDRQNEQPDVDENEEPEVNEPQTLPFFQEDDSQGL